MNPAAQAASGPAALTLFRLTDPGAGTSKTVKARQYGTPIVDEAAFGQLLRDVEPADG